MADEPLRSRVARAAAEAALVRVVHHYGDRPEFVVLGGLVPELLCSTSEYTHAGTTDVDVQVNLEIAAGSVNTARLEAALRNAEFEPDAERAWRWSSGLNCWPISTINRRGSQSRSTSVTTSARRICVAPDMRLGMLRSEK